MTAEHAAELRIVRPGERDATPGDFVFVPPEVIHQEMNMDDNAPVEVTFGRTGQGNVVVSVDVEEQ